MPSPTRDLGRPKPQQERSSRRVAEYLETAAGLFTEVGYEAATMTEIAERAGSSIGGLYRYFPDKKALALALRNRYNAEFEALWASVIEESTHQSIADFAGDLVDRMAEFVAKRPAYFKLLAAPIQLQRDAAARSQVRTQFSEVLLAKDRSLSHEKALLIARIAIQIINGMWAVYAEFEPRRRGSIVREFKRALTAYLEDVLHSN